MPRTVFLLGVALFLMALAFLATDALLWRPGVTEANARRIRPGMTLAQAEAILGSESHVIVRRPRGPVFWFALRGDVRGRFRWCTTSSTIASSRPGSGPSGPPNCAPAPLTESAKPSPPDRPAQDGWRRPAR